MPIEELSEVRRLSRDFKVRLGTRIVKQTRAVAGPDEARQPGESYPKETDYFVLEEAPKEVQALYRDKPKSLRIMLGFEWDAMSPSGDDLVFSLYNRAYGNSKGLKCRGTGRSAEKPGSARTSDQSYAMRIEKATKYAPEPFQGPGGSPAWHVKCIGRDCPLFLHKVSAPDPDNPARTVEVMAPGHDPSASCNEIGILRCFLLHPTTDTSDEQNYCRVLGVMELATTSINSIIDLQSGFDLVRAFTGGPDRGRSAGIPMTLFRKPTKTYRGAPATHYTCAIHTDQREIQRWAAVPLSEVFLSETQRALLKNLAAQPLGLSVDSVRDLIPRHLPSPEMQGERPTAPAPKETVAMTPASSTPTSQEAGGEAPSGVRSRPAPSDDPGEAPGAAESPFLVAAQLDELKQLAGGTVDFGPPDRFNNPWRPETIERLKGAIVAMRAEMGIEEAMALSELRLVHYEWLKKRLLGLPDE